MIDTQYLEKKISDSGKKKKYIAEKLGCTAQYFMMKVRNKAEFNVNEVFVLCSELNLSKAERDRIFFGH